MAMSYQLAEGGGNQDQWLDRLRIENPDREHVIYASSFCFWYPCSETDHDDERGERADYVYCLTTGPDQTTKMIRLIDMEKDFLTLPLADKKGPIGMHENTVAEEKFIFEPGGVGVTIDRAGVVKFVDEETQAHRLGVHVGMQFLRINGELYTPQRFVAARAGTTSYEVVFEECSYADIEHVFRHRSNSCSVLSTTLIHETASSRAVEDMSADELLGKSEEDMSPSRRSYFLRRSATSKHNFDDIGGSREMSLISNGENSGHGHGTGERLTRAQTILVACTDGSAVMLDPGNGKEVRELRAPSMIELLVPVVVQVLVMCQLVSFSFMPHYKWNHKTMWPMLNISGLLVLDTNAIMLTLRQTFSSCKDIRHSVVIVVNSWCCFLVVFIFLMAVILNMPGREHKFMRKLEQTEHYVQEVKDGSTGLNHNGMGREHKRFRWGRRRLTVWLGIISLSSGPLLVPVSKSFAHVIKCSVVETYVGSLINGDGGMNDDEEKACAFHLGLPVIAILCITYLTFLVLCIPFGVAMGDASVVTWSSLRDLLRPMQWQTNAENKAQLIHRGPFHVDYHSFFYEQCIEVVAKACVPFMNILLIHRPFALGCNMIIVHTILTLRAFLRPTYLMKSINVLFVGFRALGLWAGISALCVAVINNPEEKWASKLWYIGAGTIIVLTLSLHKYFLQLDIDNHDKLRNDKVVETTRRRRNGTQVPELVMQDGADGIGKRRAQPLLTQREITRLEEENA